MSRSVLPSPSTALQSVLSTVGIGFLLLSMQPLQAQEVTTDRWHTIEEGCPDDEALAVRPVVVLGSSSTVEAWKVKLRVPEGSGCSLSQPQRLRLVIDGRAVPTPFGPVGGEDGDGKQMAQIVLGETTARRLAEAEEVRIIERAIRADLPAVFLADVRRVMDKASSIARQAEGEHPEQTGAGAEDSPSSSADASSGETTSESDDRVYMVVEEQPRIVGGMAQLLEAIQYPQEARQKEVEGRVIVRFVVDEKGRAKKLEVVRGAHELLNTEALRAIREVTFEPGKQGGEPVKTQMTLPVPFRLQGGG